MTSPTLGVLLLPSTKYDILTLELVRALFYKVLDFMIPFVEKLSKCIHIQSHKYVCHTVSLVDKNQDVT